MFKLHVLIISYIMDQMAIVLGSTIHVYTPNRFQFDDWFSLGRDLSYYCPVIAAVAVYINDNVDESFSFKAWSNEHWYFKLNAHIISCLMNQITNAWGTTTTCLTC